MLPAHVCKKIVGRTLLSAAFDFPCGAELVLSLVEGPVLSVVEGVRQPQLKEGKGWASPPETIVSAIPRGALDRDTLDRCANCRNLDQLSGRAVWPSAPGRLSLATRTLDPYFQHGVQNGKGHRGNVVVLGGLRCGVHERFPERAP